MKRKVRVIVIAAALAVSHSLPCANAALVGPGTSGQTSFDRVALKPNLPAGLEQPSNQDASWTKFVLTPHYIGVAPFNSFGKIEPVSNWGRFEIAPLIPSIDPSSSIDVSVVSAAVAAPSSLAGHGEEKRPKVDLPQTVVQKPIARQAKLDLNPRNPQLAPVKIALPGFPRAMEASKERLNFLIPALAPMAFVRFCMQYAEDCAVRRMAFRPSKIKITEAKWSEITQVNREVNRAISPQANEAGVLAEEWLVSPKAGDCNDYAVTKRHQLLARGWPSRSLLLTEVVLPSGEHHLILVVRTESGDFVLDNLNANIRAVSQIRYSWVRAQSEKNPRFWASVNFARSDRVAMLVRNP